MHELVMIQKDDVFTDSWVIAEGTGNSHRSVIKMVDKYSDKFKKLGELCNHSKWTDNLRNSETIVYLMNEPQAAFLMTLLDNKDIIVDFKFNLTQQFFAMRQLLMQKQSQLYQDTRSYQKEIRKAETDAIRQLVEYAMEQGSTNARRYYVSLSKLADSTVGIKDRESATLEQLNYLAIVEKLIKHCIMDGISLHEHYKEVYTRCKRHLEQFREVAYLN